MRKLALTILISLVSVQSAQAASLSSLLRVMGAFFKYANGSPEGNRLGVSVSGSGLIVGDVNGDGFDDVIAGASKWNPPGTKFTSGRAIVFDHTGTILCALPGQQNYENLGTGVSFAGDLTGDGKDEILVGGDHHKTGNESNAGVVYLYDCAHQTILKTFEGQTAYDEIGTAVSALGDVNGDGKPDFAIGAKGRDVNGAMDSGEVKVYSGVGPNYPLLYTFNASTASLNLHASDYFGYSLSAAGDVDGDGRPDLIVGAPFADPNGKSAAGSVFVISGRTGALLARKDGSAPNDKLGASVSGVGDLNHDGKADYMAGANASNLGYARVYSGQSGAQLFQVAGGSYDQFGISVSGLGDVTGDNIPDFAVGATWDDTASLTSNGTTTIYSGANGAVAFSLEGVRSQQQLGLAIGAAGDFNNDGNNDVIVSGYTTTTLPNPSAPQNPHHVWRGSITIYSGH